MLHFLISKDLKNSFLPVLKPNSSSSIQELRWYTHRFETFEGQFLIALEEASRFCIFFKDMDTSDVLQFPIMFKNRLRQEIVSLFGTGPSGAFQVVELMETLCSDVRFSLDWSFHDAEDIFKVQEEICLSLNSMNASARSLEISLGRELNQVKRNSLVHEGAVIPANTFAAFWIRKLKSRSKSTFAQIHV